MESGWVEERDGPGSEVDERRRHYRLTRAGRQALKAEVERMEGLVRLPARSGSERAPRAGSRCPPPCDSRVPRRPVYHAALFLARRRSGASSPEMARDVDEAAEDMRSAGAASGLCRWAASPPISRARSSVSGCAPAGRCMALLASLYPLPRRVRRHHAAARAAVVCRAARADRDS